METIDGSTRNAIPPVVPPRRSLCFDDLDSAEFIYSSENDKRNSVPMKLGIPILLNKSFSRFFTKSSCTDYRLDKILGCVGLAEG